MKKSDLPVQQNIETVTKFIKKEGKENQINCQKFGMLTNIQFARKAAYDQQRKVSELFKTLPF